MLVLFGDSPLALRTRSSKSTEEIENADGKLASKEETNKKNKRRLNKTKEAEKCPETK
jgi:hypothetical protein